MKTIRFLLLAATCATAAQAQTPAAPAAAAQPPASLIDALSKGKTSLNVRLRYEHVALDNALADADALTVRTRLAYRTAAFHGFTAALEAQNTTALVDDYAFPGGTGAQSPAVTATVADPALTDISQAWLAYAYQKTNVTLGRQNLVLDNARFIGNVAWRQNYQTFDALVLRDATLDKLTLTYGYLWGVNRIFGDLSAAQPDYDSDSHILNLSYAGLPFGTLAAYAHLLDFDNAPAASTTTYGLSYTGDAALTGDLRLAYRAEYATQTDHGASTLDYRSAYTLGELGLVFAKKYGLTLGYEELGTDNPALNHGFKTPLATLHAFNGWADIYLNTPNRGLTDLYLKASATLSPKLGLLAFYHRFESDAGGLDYGDEIDLQLTCTVNKNLSLLAKAAFFNAGVAPGTVDTNKFSLQADFAF